MEKTLLERQEWAQPVLILLSLVWAYALPVEGLFLSYAILGPLHYLTQISWLHDRDYFLGNKYTPPAFLAVGLATVFWVSYVSDNFHQAAVGIWSLLLITPFLRDWRMVPVGLLLVPIVAWHLSKEPVSALLAAAFIPSVIHVGAFTLLFLLAGALRRGGAAGALSVAAWLASAAALVFLPAKGLGVHWELSAAPREFFDPMMDAMGKLVGIDTPRDHMAGIYGFLTFIYTYHYLNWFSKTELLKWQDVPRVRMGGIIILYLACLGLYFHNYAFGYMAVLALSTLHVVMEFPLNTQTIGALPGLAFNRIRPRKKAP
jgi:hypothetical protein